VTDASATRGMRGRNIAGNAVTPPESLLVGLRAGNLAVRLAKNEAEILASQRLRYKVFYEEMAARPSGDMARERRDYDGFDPHCDHLLVVDLSAGYNPADYLVGTYRLIRRAAAQHQGGFYTAGEFDIAKIEALSGEILELGRSCVAREHRNRPTMQLMWLGISTYVLHYDIGIMFGCASLAGTNVDAVAQQLSYLYHFHLAPEAFRPRALPGRHAGMNLIAKDDIDPRRALAALPPLIKGYLRLGGFVGDGAVIDEQFNTIDVCIQVKTELVTEKYQRHYERERRGSGGV
jgi:putative hemolysin